MNRDTNYMTNKTRSNRDKQLFQNIPVDRTNDFYGQSCFVYSVWRVRNKCKYNEVVILWAHLKRFSTNDI